MGGDSSTGNNTLEKIKTGFGNYSGETLYDSEADVNSDGRVDGLDLLEVAPQQIGSDIQIAYFYDASGNRFSRTEDCLEAVYEYDPDTDRLLKITKGANIITYEYDQEGNLSKKITSQDTFSYIFDYENRLKRITSQENGVVCAELSHLYREMSEREKP